MNQAVVVVYGLAGFSAAYTLRGHGANVMLRGARIFLNLHALPYQC